ncbi:MAG: hypothetical protein KDK34_19410, partial [Leptospiraceae bacterium]|nr:hypothetical protein [Leptospiraceae bacterium]
MKLPGFSHIGLRIVLMSALVLSTWVAILALGHWLLAVSRRPAMHIEYLDRPEYDFNVLRIGYLH